MKKLDINSENVFDTWRELYETLTTEEQKEFHNDIELKYPEQAHFHSENVDWLLSFMLIDNESVLFDIVEMGGWKGDLAKHCIDKNGKNINKWTNMELCENAINKSVFSDTRYMPMQPDSFTWFENSKLKGDCFISTHVIEHLSNKHFISLVDYLSENNYKYVLFEAPLYNNDHNWKGYLGTHILGFGWESVVREMSAKGFELLHSGVDCRIFVK